MQAVPTGERYAEPGFIVFELTKIKKDPFLISVIMTILFDTIENKILSDRSVRGMLIFESTRKPVYKGHLFRCGHTFDGGSSVTRNSARKTGGGYDRPVIGAASR